MVNSVRKFNLGVSARALARSLVIAPALGTALALAPALALAQDQDEAMRVSLDAEWSSFDRQSNTMMFRGLHIAQGDFAIEADEAVASDLDFNRSEWNFNGNVRIGLDTATIESTHAEVVFETHELLVVELTGDPAEFQDRNAERGDPILGGAEVLRYDSAERTLRMTGGAWLSEGPNEFSGCDLIYDIDEKKITSGSSECGEPVVISILPPADDADDADAP